MSTSVPFFNGSSTIISQSQHGALCSALPYSSIALISASFFSSNRNTTFSFRVRPTLLISWCEEIVSRCSVRGVEDDDVVVISQRGVWKILQGINLAAAERFERLERHDALLGTHEIFLFFWAVRAIYSPAPALQSRTGCVHLRIAQD